MKLRTIALAVTAACAAISTPTVADEGALMMRVRAVDAQWANKSDAIPVAGLSADAVHIDNKLLPEVDFTYFLTKNLAAELILTYPQTLNIKVPAANLTAGTVKALPPTLTLQYHFIPDGEFRPYVGAGINFTNFSDLKVGNLDAVTSGITQTLAGVDSKNNIDRGVWGGALQAGFDFKVGPNGYINLDIKKVFIKTDLTNSVAGKLSTIKADPYLIGLGYGFRF